MFCAKNGKLAPFPPSISLVVKFKDVAFKVQQIPTQWLRLFVIIFDFKNMFLRCEGKLVFCCFFMGRIPRWCRDLMTHKNLKLN